MTNTTFHETAWRRWLVYLAGIILGNLMVAALYFGITVAMTALMAEAEAVDGLANLGPALAWTIGLPSLFLVPLVGGIGASYVWRRLAPSIGATVLASLLMTGLGLAGSMWFMGEGAICLIIVSPLYFAVILAGALLGRSLFKADRSRLNLMVFPLIIFLAVGEMATRQDRVGVVSDEILIQAPPEKIWPLLTAFPDIPTPPRFWLFRIGLPYPMATTTEGNFVGAKRACIFSGDAVFEEVVSEFEPGKKLTFEILKLPPDPELIGHLTPQRGRFTLRDNGDGSTTLIGDTWYTLHVRPLGYFNWWTQHIFRAVHLRVMEDIRRRAEEAS